MDDEKYLLSENINFISYDIQEAVDVQQSEILPSINEKEILHLGSIEKMQNEISKSTNEYRREKLLD